MGIAGRPLHNHTRWFWALFAVISLAGCATTSRVQDDAAAPVAVVDAAFRADTSGAPRVANAVLSQGRGGYQRTTVPPEFLVLMLGVPLLILLL